MVLIQNVIFFLSPGGCAKYMSFYETFNTHPEKNKRCYQLGSSVSFHCLCGYTILIAILLSSHCNFLKK